MAAVLLALLSPQSGSAVTEPGVAHLYILTFNGGGELQNPGERDLAIRELSANDSIERIIIFSYG